MSDRPMHNVPGLYDRLTALYTDGVRALEDGRLLDAVAVFSEGLQLDDQFRQAHVTMYAQRAFAYQRLTGLPDIVVVAKPLAGGLPLGAFLAHAHIVPLASQCSLQHPRIELEFD